METSCEDKSLLWLPFDEIPLPSFKKVPRVGDFWSITLMNTKPKSHVLQADNGGSTASRLTVSDFAEENDCELALNASFFELENTGTSLFEYSNSESYKLKSIKIINYFTWGPTIANGSSWKNSKLFPIFPDFVGYFSLDYAGNFSISKYEPSFQKNPYLMVSGLPILITNGQSVHLVNAPKAREPRTAVGLTQNNDLLFVIIDGRNSGISEGVDLLELQKIMLALGAKEALNLDGGGSSTLYIRSLGGIVNRPSEEGIQRVVANHLGLCTKSEGSKHD